MVRIIADNVQKLLSIRFKGVIKVHVVNYDTLVIDIINGNFVYHNVVTDVSTLVLNCYGSPYIADKISKDYRNKINSIFFK